MTFDFVVPASSAEKGSTILASKRDGGRGGTDA
jgi:hypothetical protein